jgi:methyltransferase FkbM-like protein
MSMALGGTDGVATFGPPAGGTGNSVAFRVGAGCETVEVRSLDSLLGNGLDRPSCLKLDIEGSEADTLRGGSRTLRHVGCAIISVHSFEIYRDCIMRLRDAGFVVYTSSRNTPVLSGLKPWTGDPDIVALKPDRETKYATELEGLVPVA